MIRRIILLVLVLAFLGFAILFYQSTLPHTQEAGATAIQALDNDYATRAALTKAAK